MATWQDGPEYAPQERPAAFVTPAVPPLAAPPPVLTAPPPAPEVEPSFSPPQDAQPDLATLVPAAAPGRNPTVPFEVSAAAITAGGGRWSAREPLGGGTATSGGRTPTQPFNAPGPPVSGYLPVQPAVQPNAQVNPAHFPAPNTPQWFAPPPETRVPAPPPPVTISQIWHATTPGVMIPLLIGMVLPWLSLVLLGVSFLLSARIPYRRAAIRRAYSIAWILLAVTFGLTLLEDGYDAQLLFDGVSGTARLVCVVLPVVLGLIVGAALRAGERPDRLA